MSFRLHDPHRRLVMATAASWPLACASLSWASENKADLIARAAFEKLEKELAGRLGVFAFNTANGARLAYRDGDRFALCSTFKVIAASALLARSANTPGWLQQRIRYAASDLVAYSPVTEKHVAGGMTVAELCAAGLQYSDNTAGNLLIRQVGGPSAVTAYARTLGDGEFRLDRWETELNSAIPGDPRDTTTPGAMGRSLHRLMLGNALAADGRAQLKDWLLGNTTGGARIKAGVPADWTIGDKTGGGSYGTGHDIAVAWPPGRPPLVLTVYTAQPDQDAKARGDVVAAAARVVVDWLEVS